MPTPEQEILRVIDPKNNHVIEKSRTAFISIDLKTGTINISNFLARSMGIVSGDRVSIANGTKNKYVVFIFKNPYREKSGHVTIRNGTYKVHSKPYMQLLQSIFSINPEHKRLVRLYVNFDSPISIEGLTSKAYQIFDIPYLREDFTSEDEKLKYIENLKNNPYILKKSE
jgi:hypothetical protein